MNHVIALSGTANSGKSSTIKKTYQRLLEEYPQAEVDVLHEETEVEVSVIVTIGKIRVGIESQGDPGSRLPESLREFLKAECKIILCATRTRGATVKAVEDLEPKYKATWHRKEKAKDNSSMEAENRALANKILTNIQIHI